MLGDKALKRVLQIASGLVLLMLSGCSHLVVLQSKGPVGRDETWLIIVSFILMLIVVVPVYVMVILFTRKYRASNTKANYMPYWAHSTAIEWFIWLIPIAIIVALSWLTLVKTNELDPYKPLISQQKSIQVEVISTDWNWLFIYPDEQIAVANELVIPVNTPVSFRITSASVMTSLFIPQLGSMMYAMAGMQTRLNLMASDTGIFEGHNQEYSGNGYHSMNFKVIATTREKFNAWVSQAKNSTATMDMATFMKFSEPSMDYPVTLYNGTEPGLFDTIFNQYMSWMGGTDHNMKNMPVKNSDMPAMSDSCHMKPKHMEEQ